MSDNDENSVEQKIAALKKKNEALLDDNRRYHHLLSNLPGSFYPQVITALLATL